MKFEQAMIGQPVRSVQTMLRTIAAVDPAINAVVPDGIYGPSTSHAVTSFQRKHGLPATGITNQETWDLIVEVYELALIETEAAQPIQIGLDTGQSYTSGDSNPYIYLLQSILTHLANEHSTIPSVEHNGTMDASTIAAIQAFQKLSELPQTGELNKLTWKHLVSHYSLSAQNSIRRNKK